MSGLLGKCCGCVGGCVSCLCKFGTPRQRMLSAWLLLLAVSLAFCVCAGITATTMLAVQSSITDSNSNDVGCQGHTIQLQLLTLLSADCVAGIFLALLHFLMSGWVLAGRAFTRGSPGTVYTCLMVASFYSGICLFTLAGTLNIGEESTKLMVDCTSNGIAWVSSDQVTYTSTWALQYAVGGMQFVFLLVLLQSRTKLIEEAVASLGLTPEAGQGGEAPRKAGLFGMGGGAAAARGTPPPAELAGAAAGGGGFFARNRGAAAATEAPLPAAAMGRAAKGGGGKGRAAPAAPGGGLAPPAPAAAGSEGNPFGAPAAGDNPWGASAASGSGWGAPRANSLFNAAKN